MNMYMDTHNVHYNIIETICGGLRVRKKVALTTCVKSSLP